MSHSILLPCAGTGSRLGSLTRSLNKCLVPVGEKPALTHIIERCGRENRYVIVLGYRGNLVREYIQHAHPTLEVEFVEVDVFDGPGSGLGRSILAARERLQTPFIFVSCDTLVTNELAPPSENWLGYSRKLERQADYRTVRVGTNGLVSEIEDKAREAAPARYPYIGLAGIHDYSEFWDSTIEGGQRAIDLGEIVGIERLIPNGVRAYAFDWFDIGNPSALAEARASDSFATNVNVLDKPDEAIWLLNDRVVKFSNNKEFIHNRSARSLDLAPLVPQVIGATEHMYSYLRVEGDVLSKSVNREILLEFMNFCAALWVDRATEIDESLYTNLCDAFYRKKTIERVDQFVASHSWAADGLKVNGVRCRPIAVLLGSINWDDFSAGCPTRFHGDLHFENVLRDFEGNHFTLLDWRQDFGGNTRVGDLYYDLAKILHGIVVSHEEIRLNNFKVKRQDRDISIQIRQDPRYQPLGETFLGWCEQHGYSREKIITMTGLIFLNIAALHHSPYDDFLFALGVLISETGVIDDGIFTSQP